MSNPVSKFFVPALAATVLMTGCATTHPRKPDQAAEPSSQVQALQAEVHEKDQQIQDLQYQLDSQQQSVSGGSSSSGAGRSKLIHVSGVSVTDLQKALQRAGLDPGPIDGHMGKKTKSAIKEFQKKNNLKADGVVGDKTWSLLR